MEPKRIRIEASRYNLGGETVLFYHGEYSRFDPMTTRMRLED